jgi:hypothetical protein
VSVGACLHIYEPCFLYGCPPSPPSVSHEGALTKLTIPGTVVRNRIESFKATFLTSTNRTRCGRAAQKITDGIVVDQAARQNWSSLCDSLALRPSPRFPFVRSISLQWTCVIYTCPFADLLPTDIVASHSKFSKLVTTNVTCHKA